jgi:hypothetical protein
VAIGNVPVEIRSLSSKNNTYACRHQRNQRHNYGIPRALGNAGSSLEVINSLVRCLVWAIRSPVSVPSAEAGLFYSAKLNIPLHEGALRSMDESLGA